MWHINQDFAEKLKLNIQYYSEIVSVAREKSDGAMTGKFVLENSNWTSYHCGIVVVRYYVCVRY